MNSLLWILPDLFLYLCMYINIHTQTYIYVFNLKIGLHIYIYVYLYVSLYKSGDISFMLFCNFLTCLIYSCTPLLSVVKIVP